MLIDPLRVLAPTTDKLEVLALLVIADPVLIDKVEPSATVPVYARSSVPDDPIETAPVPSAAALAALRVPALIVVPPVKLLLPERVVVPVVFWTSATVEVPFPLPIVPVLKVVAFAPVKVSMTGVPVDEGPVTLPVKVTPEVSSLLIALLANTLIVRALLKAAPVEILRLPPLRLMAPEVFPR